MKTKAAMKPARITGNKIFGTSSRAQLSGDSLKRIIKRFVNNHPANKPSSFSLRNIPASNNICIDTSFVKLLNTYASIIYIEKVTPLAESACR